MAVITKVLPGRIVVPNTGEKRPLARPNSRRGLFPQKSSTPSECCEALALAASALAAYDAPFAFL
jgi:hypothetical protein